MSLFVSIIKLIIIPSVLFVVFQLCFFVCLLAFESEWGENEEEEEEAKTLDADDTTTIITTTTTNS